MKTDWDEKKPGFAADRAISVSELNSSVAAVLERNFPLAWVSGEISNFTRATSGHWYFSIKDARAQMRCVMFRGRAQHADFSPREGDRVEVRALLSMYEPRGEVQLNVEAIRRAGQGNLYEAFLRLKEKLAAAGLFDAQRKVTDASGTVPLTYQPGYTDSLGRYVELFNARDWDGVRALTSADARLRVSDCYNGLLSRSPYFVEYERGEPWRMRQDAIEGEAVLVVDRLQGQAWRPAYLVRIHADGGVIDRIADYYACPWILEMVFTDG